jgi:hypothetical protein
MGKTGMKTGMKRKGKNIGKSRVLRYSIPNIPKFQKNIYTPKNFCCCPCAEKMGMLCVLFFSGMRNFGMQGAKSQAAQGKTAFRKHSGMKKRGMKPECGESGRKKTSAAVRRCCGGADQPRSMV